ncbi:glycine zipper 2TM domain-containing protein [uncultured Phenylobacterium sp.]|uniref:glycine zipper 2TM domain-containing protein n=1 Tax=uncultured Phenylobacterium sp. TaxID=349273 RepID=UPI0025F5D5CB|nr:glycine zipper 2TM domain-containing protein [uncultured Phenylobacterium sp.]
MKSLRIGMVSVLALASAAPVYAQQYRETPESSAARQDYDRQRDRYEAQQDQYREDSRRYEGQRRNYREARRDYDRRLAEWERARRIYDTRYGYGSYARMYSRPVWNQTYWSSYNPPPYAGYYGRNSAATGINCSTDNSTAAGGIIGALAGAVLGSQIAGRGDRTEGAVLGGVVGAAVGAGVGNANAKYRCDNRGPYFAYDDTIAYREGRNRYASSYDYSYYTRNRCRLAPAPVDSYGRDYRYVRVCPDEEGRYRITG